MKTTHAGMGWLVLLFVCLISHAGAGTIEEMLTTCDPYNTHGNTQSLTADELKALIEYVLSR